MRMKIALMLLLLTLSAVKADIQFSLLWQAPGAVTDIEVSDLNADGYSEILMATGSSHEKIITTPSGSATAMVCEGTVSQYKADSTLIWEKKLCLNDSAAEPCYSNGCISAIAADSICTTTRKLIFTSCCYCGTSSIIRVHNSEGVLLQELYDNDGMGNPVNITGCVRKIIISDIDADNCKEIIAVTNLDMLIYDTDCTNCTIPILPTYRVRDLPLADRPSGMIYDVIVVNFDDDANPTKEIVVAADEVTVYEDDLTLKWKYEVDPARPVRTVYAYDVDSDTAAHEIDQDPDLEPELIVGESWYLYVLDNIEYGDTDPTNDDPNLKWEYSTSPYDVNTVYAGKFIGPRNVLCGAASMVNVLDYNGTMLKTFNCSGEVRNLECADFDKDSQNELTVFSNGYISIFSTTGFIWSSENLQGNYIKGMVRDINLDQYPEIVAGYGLGLYVIGVGELKKQTDSEADQLYDLGESLVEKGDYIKAVVYFEQARVKYEEAGNTFMSVQCQKKITECEKFMDSDRTVATAMEQLRNYGYEEAGYLFGEAGDLYAKMGDKTKMSQMRVLKETSEKLTQAHNTLREAHSLLLDKKYSEARVEATWARNTFEDVSNLFLTMSLDSLYDTLRLEMSARIRECDEVVSLCEQLSQVDTQVSEAEQHQKEGERYFRSQQYSEARQAYEQSEAIYTSAAAALDDIQISLGKRADNFRRDIQDIEGKIKTLETSELYKSYEDISTGEIIADLEEKKSSLEDLIDEYGDFAESVGRKAREYRSRASAVSAQADQCYSFEDQFMESARQVLQPPASLAVGLGCLIVALIGLAVGKGRYVALVFLVLVLIFLGISALRVIQ
jgi:tetratricopeptide (TPR) repeat protein